MESAPKEISLFNNWYEKLDQETKDIVTSAFFNNGLPYERAVEVLDQEDARSLLGSGGLIDLYLQEYRDTESKKDPIKRRETLKNLAKDVTDYIGRRIEAQL